MTQKVMVSFPEEFLSQVDALAQAEHRSRSGLIREALRRYMQAREDQIRPGDLPQVHAAVASINALSQVAPGAGEDSTEDVRRWREARR